MPRYLNPRSLWKNSAFTAFYAGFSIWNQKQPQKPQVRTRQPCEIAV